MKDILVDAAWLLTEELANQKVLLAFDFDGTLAPIVPAPDRAEMRQETRALLFHVARQFPCAVISGRSQQDVSGRLRGIPLVGTIGNHGREPWHRRESSAADVQRWLAILRDHLADLAGVAIEDKRYSLAVHYRHAADGRNVNARILQIAGELDGARMISGKEVVNLVPLDGPTKGDALKSLRHRIGCDIAFYVGDDETDEDAFSLVDEGWVIGVRVERTQGSRAGFYLRDQAQMDSFLRMLLGLRLKRDAPSTWKWASRGRTLTPVAGDPARIRVRPR